MKAVKIMFADSQYDYTTSVNPKATDEELKKYFIGARFNVGAYPVENMKQCININIVNTENKRDIAIRQIELQEKIQASGINIVTCGNCGNALLHEITDETIDCFCGLTMDLSDCPDLYYNGMENNNEFND
jgi:hypothetical protein